MRILALLLGLISLSTFGQGTVRYARSLTNLLSTIDPANVATGDRAAYMVPGYIDGVSWGGDREIVATKTPGTTNLGCTWRSPVNTNWYWRASDCSGNAFDIRWFGAIPDDALDDTSAFDAALVAAVQWRGESGGGIVYVPAGDFRLNWNMTSPYANEESITITGDGPGATALRPYTNTTPVLKLLGRNITLEKLMIKGDILAPQGVGLQLGDTNLATGAVVAANFRDLYILDFDTGLYIEGIDQAHFDGMVIQRCTNGLLAYPRWYATSGTNAVMSKVKFTRSVWLGNYGDAITIRGGYAEQIDFDTCVIEQNYGKAVVIQQYNPIAGNPFRGFQFRNCFFEFNNFAAPVGDYYDIEFQPAVGTGANAIYSSMIEGCWFQTVRSSHTPIHILNGGDYRIQNNDFISNNSYFISVTNSPVIDLDVSFAKVLVEAGSSPQINWVNANRVELRGLTNATPSLILTNTGRLLFSDGVNAPDLSVYRSAARVLAAEGTFRSIGTAATDQAFLAGVSGDSLGRFTVLNNGRFEWGDGAGARSIFMERAGSGVMEMKGATWTFNRANATDWAIQTYATGDSQYRLSLRADGRMEWSDGSNPAGISLAPASGNILNLLATYRVQRTNATDSAYLTGVLGESTSRFEIDSAGRMSWGDGTGTRTHGSIERTSTGTLTIKTNLSIPVGSLTLGGDTIDDLTGSYLGVSGGKLNVTGLGGMAYINDAPSDGQEYVRKNAAWAVSSGGGGGGATNGSRVHVDGVFESSPNFQDTAEIDPDLVGTNTVWNIVMNSIETNKLSVAAYLALMNRTNHYGNLDWSFIIGTPTTLGGYAITDAQPLSTTLTRIAGIGLGTSGDILFRDAAGWTNLAKSTDGKVLKLTSGFPSWQDDATGGGGVSDGDKGDITISGSGTVYTIDVDSVALSTDTTGNYVASVSGTANETSVSGSGEGAAVIVGLATTIDLGSKTSFELPNAAAPTVDAFGEIAGDDDAWGASRGAPVFYDGTAAVRLVGVLASDTPSNGQVPKWNTGGTITWEDDTGGTGGGSTNYVNNLPYLPLKFTNDTASVGGIVWTTNANGDVKAQATNLPTVTNSPVTGLWQTLGSADIIVENLGGTTADVTYTNYSGVVSLIEQIGSVGSSYRLQLKLTFSQNIGTNYLVFFDFDGSDDSDSSYALVGWSQSSARTGTSCELSIINTDSYVYSNDGFKIRIRVVNPNATAGGAGGDMVTTANNVLSGVNQFTNGLGQVFSVPPRVLGGRINGWTAPQMTPGTNAATQAQYKVLGDGVPAVEFDGTTSEEISMVGLLGQDPDRGSFVTITFASDDTANTVCWQAQWQLLTLRGIDTNLLSTAATWTSNIPGTARVPTNITFSLNAPTGVVGSTNDFSKPYMLRVTRLPGSDSSLSNAYLIGVDHRYGL